MLGRCAGWRDNVRDCVRQHHCLCYGKIVIGDTALALDENGKPAPGIAPAAKQQGKVRGRRHRGSDCGETGSRRISISTLRFVGDDRTQICGRGFRLRAVNQFGCLVPLGSSAYFFHDRIPKPFGRAVRLAMGGHDVRTQRASDLQTLDVGTRRRPMSERFETDGGVGLPHRLGQRRRAE